MSEKTIRGNVNDTVKMSLLCEVNGSCPLCRKDLIVKKKLKNVRVFDVAHIYPLHPTPHEEEILKGETLLSEDIDSEANFIALCKECHKVYDTQKTVKEYRQLVAIKNEINKIKELSVLWDKQTLHKDISVVANKIGLLDELSIKNTLLSYDALKISDKKDDTFGMINEIKVSQFILSFFIPIKEALKDLEKQEKAKSTFICSQVKSYYVLLLMKDFNQAQIFEKMTDWFMKNTGITDRSKSEVLVSFFIQNCEVYSKC
ncbi:HNH endonuclease [Colwellia sp. 1_MG-2023]|uniref:ABC-three component system protein n=1 Tax=unclassified Colwellia TaxID=196834 RepID=UPI001C09FA00|nr:MULTISPECIES: ABC-three component system protein [unclassified Colwellia]MBU2925233.1 HNH endonuclease [Colwellia sp. C2M11]MDO6651242.1 HNH endonuclease [Colwellia sp. 3_MG-2023]MDO6664335.1 HNH endonuclease [Colwellia sp. 2_MG-2023]MDO6688551.1 HNH endonuclease [Colwellia sp. 1_MG-2023]